MKSIVCFVVFFIIGVHVHAQTWQNNLPLAIKEAARDNKKVLLFFSVLDYCDTCRMLEKNVFATSMFQNYASSNFVLVKIDFSNQSNEISGEQKEQNLLIVEKYNKDGFFPLVVILNKDAKIIGKMNPYKNETPQQYIAQLQLLNKS